MMALALAIAAPTAFAVGWRTRGKLHNLARDTIIRLLASDVWKRAVLKRLAKLDADQGEVE